MNAEPLADARAFGLRVCTSDLGGCAPVRLVAEYDRAARTIRISAAAVAAVRREHGDAAADALTAAAVAHELYHHAVAEGRLRAASGAAEAEERADRYARERYGIDQARFERLLRRCW